MIFLKSRVSSALFGFVITLASFVTHAAVIDVGSQTGGTFSGNVRGYYFVAPIDFTITGLGVPLDASAGNFDVTVLRFNSTIPQFSNTTNDFDTLFLSRNNAGTGLVSTNISINAGDIIGILGYRDRINSYGTPNYLSEIAGFDVPLRRLGIQNILSDTDPADSSGVWAENSGEIGRVLFEYQLSAVPEPENYALMMLGLGLISFAVRRNNPN